MLFRSNHIKSKFWVPIFKVEPMFLELHSSSQVVEQTSIERHDVISFVKDTVRVFCEREQR